MPRPWCTLPRSRGRPACRPATCSGRTWPTVYNVVEAAVLNGATRLVYASSMSVLGYPFFETPIAPLLPAVRFGPSGRAAGRLCPLEMAGRGGGRGGRAATAGPHGGQPSHAVDPDRGDLPARRRRPARPGDARRSRSLGLSRCARCGLGFRRRGGATDRRPPAALHQRRRHLHGDRDRGAGPRRLSGRRR